MGSKSSPLENLNFLKFSNFFSYNLLKSLKVDLAFMSNFFMWHDCLHFIDLDLSYIEKSEFRDFPPSSHENRKNSSSSEIVFEFSSFPDSYEIFLHRIYLKSYYFQNLDYPKFTIDKFKNCKIVKYSFFNIQIQIPHLKFLHHTVI